MNELTDKEDLIIPLSRLKCWWKKYNVLLVLCLFIGGPNLAVAVLNLIATGRPIEWTGGTDSALRTEVRNVSIMVGSIYSNALPAIERRTGTIEAKVSEIERRQRANWSVEMEYDAWSDAGRELTKTIPTWTGPNARRIMRERREME